MRQNAPESESAEWRRLWLWAVAALLAVALLIVIARWTARQETSAVSLPGAHLRECPRLVACGLTQMGRGPGG